MSEREFTIEAVPFSWNDNFSEIAMEDFDSYRSDLSYRACRSIGMALAKLQMIENGVLIRNERGEWVDEREES